MAFNRKREPVFRVRKWRGGGNYFRTPRTWIGHKQAQNIDDDEPRPRPKRDTRLLLDAWDDVSRCRQRSWKVHRKVQHRK